MKIYECCPFFNENLVARIKMEESGQWIDELHITESNKTFTYLDKEYCFEHHTDPLVRYHRIDGPQHFKKPRWGISRYRWFIKYKTFQWYNEAVQRNLACSFLEPQGGDVVILSDIDEIIDHKHADRIIELVRQHEIITVKLHFTCYFFDLYLRNRGGPSDFSYRVFIMSGDYFNRLKSSNELRRKGERSELLSTVYCYEPVAGFHHSWLGDVNQIEKKLISYSHTPEDHDKNLFTDGKVNRHYIQQCIEEKKSFYGKGPEIFQDAGIDLMDSVTKLRYTAPEFFV